MQWPPNSPGRNGRKFHLVPAALRTAVGIDSKLIKDNCQFVDECDVKVTLRLIVLIDHLRY
jgi:hypothetical protein